MRLWAAPLSAIVIMGLERLLLLQPLSRRIYLLSAACLILIAAPTVAAQQISFYEIGYGPDGVSKLVHFDNNGVMISERKIPETESVASAALHDGTIYVDAAVGLITEYDLSGNYLDQFPNVASQAGNSLGNPDLESDAAGNIYADFGGEDAEPRTSFRLDRTGAVSQTFSHPDLRFPTGIDAAANHDVYVVTGTANANGDKLYRFNAAGTFVASYPLPQPTDPFDLAIDEARNDLYVADEYNKSIFKYDISSGAPVFLGSIPLPRYPTSIYVEPSTGDLFGLLYGIVFGDTPAFHFSQSSGTLNLFYSDSIVPGAIVAVAVPEPDVASLVLVLGISRVMFRRKRTSRDRVWTRARRRCSILLPSAATMTR